VEGYCKLGNELVGSINIETFLSSFVTGDFSSRAELLQVRCLLLATQ
jgi:hypothetical protein